MELEGQMLDNSFLIKTAWVLCCLYYNCIEIILG